jgi:hypothetical protein
VGIAVEPGADARPAPGGKRDEVLRYEDFPEAVAPFELSEAAAVLVTVVELAVG